MPHSSVALPRHTNRLSPRRISAAALWWLADSGGAVLFAGCLALLLGEWMNGDWAVHQMWLLAGLAVSGLLRGIAQGAAMMSGQGDAAKIKRGQRGALLAALLPTGLIRGQLAGEDLRLAVDDVEAGEGLAARFMPLRLASILSPLIIAAVISCASWVSALIMLATLLPFGLGMALAGLSSKGEADRQFQALSRLSGLFVDRVSALPMILSFGAEGRVTRQIGGAATDVAIRTLSVLRIAFVSSAILEFFAALSVALVAVYCGFSLLGLLPFPAPETLTLSSAFFALAMAPEFYLGMRRLAAAYHDKQQGDAATTSINAALADAQTSHLADSPLPLFLPPIIAVEALEIVYGDGGRIGPIDAQWPGPGLHVIRGQTGSGKSSLLHALIGVAPVGAGLVRWNGQAALAGTFNSHIGWAGQRTLLLPGTLGDNLSLASGSVEPDALAELLAACGLSSLIEQRGLALQLDSRGSGLSGGERRRIGLVRAIASNRPVLLLDEPTADLDAATAGQVITLLTSISRHRLVIAATHDDALIAIADSVVKLP